MGSRKIILIFTLSVFIFLLAGTVSAYQKKMTMEECLMSYNDENYGPWDEANHRGVFVKVINHNLNLGEAESADYEYINYQTNNPLNSMPILNVEPGKPNMFYAKCTQKVGDYRIYFEEYLVPYQGDGNGLHLSPDFNFNNGVTVEASAGGFISTASPAKYNGVASSFQHYQYNLKLSPHGSLYYADNGVNSGYDADALAVHKEGFFPNTQPVMMTKLNLTDYASGVLLGYSLIRETGYIMLIDPIYTRFYLNSSTRDIEDFLAPKVVAGGSITNPDNPNKQGVNTINTLACTEAANDCFDMSQGGRMQMTYMFRNVFSISLSDINVRNVWTTSAGRKGFGVSRTDVLRYMPAIIYEDILDIPAFTTAAYTIERDIPADNNYIWANTHGYIMFRNIFGDYAQAQYFRPGDDDESLIGFRNFDPRIEMQKNLNKYEPFFNLNVTLATADTRFNYEEVFPGDFELLFEMWNGTHVKDSYTVPGVDVFTQAGVTSLPQGGIIEYGYLIPIRDEYAAESAGGADYEVHVYVVSKNGGKFDGLKIATPTNIPVFTPGDITYQWDNLLTFGNDSKVDSEKIIIFNPSFYENDINLEIQGWSDDENFSLSWDGVNFGQTSKTVHLFPLQSKEITFWVNATYDPWIDSDVLEDVTITVSADLKTGDTQVSKSQNLNFILDVSPDSLNWFNINPYDFFPEVVLLDTLNSSKSESVTVTWNLEGGEIRWAELAGQSYEVEVKLINGTELTDEVLKELTATFTVAEDGETQITFDYDFIFGEYLLVLNLDSNNQIAELLSSGEDAEFDNYNAYVLPLQVTYCYYAADGYMHRVNFFGDDVVDKENKCECPRGLVTVADEGYCGNPAYDCSSFTTLGVGACNDWELTKPGSCGWESDVISPVGPITPGDCLGCNNISNTCSGYNNDVTCNLDPCQKASLYDCPALNCNVNEVNGCVWDSGVCKFEGTFSGGTNCRYEGNVVGVCDGTIDGVKIKFESLDVGCPPKERIVACPQEAIAMSFFSIFNLISAIVLITLFYGGRELIDMSRT